MIIAIQNGKIKTLNKNLTQYDGEKIPGDLLAWNYLGTDPNEILKYTYDRLSQRSTTLYHTHAPIAAAINKRTHYAVGPGLVYRSQPDWEILGIKKDYAKDWSMRFQKMIHYLFLSLNFYEKQNILFKNAHITGDSLLIFDRGYSDNLPFDLIEVSGDQIDMYGQSKYKNREMTLGISHDSFFRKLGVKLTDGTEINFKNPNGDQNILQIFFKNMARQLRGYPLAYKLISAAKNNDRWWDATLSRLVMETLILGVSKETSQADSFSRQTEDLANLVNNSSSTGPQVTGFQSELTTKNMIPGSVYSYTGKDSGFEFTDLKTPSNNFDKVQNAYLDIVGMGMDTPPEVMLSKYTTSFTAHKGALNDFIKSYMSDRHRFINNTCKPVVIECAKWLFMNQLIEMPHPDFLASGIIQNAVVAGAWLGPVPGHINPLQEVAANEKAVNAGFDLRSNIAQRYGNEWDNFTEEWQQEQKAFYTGSLDAQAKQFEQDLLNQSGEN